MFGEDRTVAMTAVVKQVVNPTTVTIVTHGEVLKARVLGNMTAPTVGDAVLVGFLRDANEYYLLTGQGATGPGVPCIEYNPPYPSPPPIDRLYVWCAVNRSSGYSAARRYRIQGTTFISASPVTDFGEPIEAIRSPRWDPDTCIAITIASSTIKVYRTVDGGQSWTNTFTLSCGVRHVQQSTLWIDPNDPTYVYFGTYGLCVTPGWLYASLDGGVNFTLKGSGPGFYFENYNSVGIRSIRRSSPDGLVWIMHDPTPITPPDGSGQRHCNWLSTSINNGATWTNPYNGNWWDTTREDYGGGCSSEDGLKFAGVMWKPGGNGGIWTSLDEGVTFPLKNGDFPGFPGMGDSVDISIVNDGIWFARSDLHVHAGTHYPYKSTDDGVSWTALTTIGTILDSRGAYCDFFDAATFWLFGIDITAGGICGKKSTDSGTSWSNITSGENMNRTSISYGPGNDV